MNKTIKKYPIFYQGEEYEIRIERPYFKLWNFTKYVCIYKVTRKKWFWKEKLSYELVDNIELDFFNCYEDIDPKSETYYIELFKAAFNLYLRYENKKLEGEKIESTQLNKLKEWDGVIS